MYVLLEHQSVALTAGYACGSCAICAESGKPNCGTTRSGANCARSCRWFSTRANAAGPTRRNLPTCSPEVARGLPWVPRFNHELLDQTTLNPAAVGGEVKGRITQLLLMAPVSQDPETALDWAARWTLALSEVGGGIDERRRFIEYLAAIQDGALINQFDEASKRHGLNLEEDIMSYAQQLLDEGRAEGRAEGEARGEARKQVEIVEGLLRVGVTWDVIEAATELTEAGFQELKARVAKPDSLPTDC